MLQETESEDDMSDSDSPTPHSTDTTVSETIFQRFRKVFTQEVQSNPYEDIRVETKLLVQVKDILDELNILRTLVQDQQHVYTLWNCTESESKVYHIPHMVERQEEIKSMVDDVTSVQEAIKSLLDLKQKEATIIEAQNTRKQSANVMVFTVVTIVFVSFGLYLNVWAGRY
ncbi:hypothetical protein N7488_005833 [Penicillium malachiteum]|nr:hypothetical protein N7488_005833 [Penicillium malachiteum]